MNLTAFKQSSKFKNPHYLLFGHPVEHSWSPLMHNAALEYYGMDARYYAVDLQNSEINDLPAFLNQSQFLGANITIPYKQLIAEFVDGIDQPAREIGAINTIVKQDYRLQGYNTDVAGFISPLKGFKYELEGTGAVVFGTGGAARAVVVALIKLGVGMIYLVSRNPARISSFREFEQVKVVSYSEWTTRAEESSLIVNATPLGMHPNIEQSPVRESEMQWLGDHICYDIVYNPLKTTFLRQAEKAGATTIGGLEMLIQQGSQSFKLWTGRPFPVKIVRNKLHEKLAD